MFLYIYLIYYLHNWGDIMSGINNMEFDEKENSVVVSINPKIYSLEVVYSACYSMIDKNYVIIGGDPKKEILVELRSKENKNLEIIGRDFNNELVNYAVYLMQSERNKTEKEILMKRALQTNTQNTNTHSENIIGSAVKDTQNIAVPWQGDKKC